MAKAPTTYAVPLTPHGRGAVAVVLVSGAGALAAVAEAFSAANGKPLGDQPLGRAVLGRWGRSLESPGEELIVCRRAGDRLEVHPHGGVASVRSVIDRLVSAGCVALDWQDWIVHDDADPIRAAARIALADAPTGRTAAILLDQYHGALRRALEALELIPQLSERPRRSQRPGRLRDCPSAEDLSSGPGQPAETAGHAPRDLSAHPAASETTTETIASLLARADLGRHLTRPWSVVVAGPPNVGKSSLVNAMLGYTRAIVHDQPGTTRDVVTATTAVDGWPVEFLDTAGLHHGSDAVEVVGIAYARRQLAEADLVLWVEDAAKCGPPMDERRWTNRDERALGALGDRAGRLLHVSNKIDLLNAEERSRLASGNPRAVSTSTVTGEGIPELVTSIASLLVPDPPPPGAAVPFTDDQIALLQAGSPR